MLHLYVINLRPRFEGRTCFLTEKWSVKEDNEPPVAKMEGKFLRSS